MTALRSFCVATCLLAGCVSKITYQGVTNYWRSPEAPRLERQKTSMSDVLGAFGPPSQIISAGDRTIFYYLLERRRQRAVIAIVYNQTREWISYDRAMFIFDSQQRLLEMGYSKEAIPFHEMPTK